MMQRHGQSAMEYLLIIGFSTMLLLPLIIIAFSESSNFADEVAAAQIRKAADRVGDAADAVYYTGPPAKRTLRLQFPERIQDVTIAATSITFRLQGQGGPYEYVAWTAANLTGTLGTFPGTHRITIEATDAPGGQVVVSIAEG